jgi:hypothetical protein
MTQATKFDPRLAPITQHVKSMASPQAYYSEKAGTFAPNGSMAW